MIKPEELRRPEFSKGFKGYAPAEVDAYTDRLLAAYGELYAKYTETEQKLAVAVEKYKETAGKSDEVMNNVKKLSEAIIADAQKEHDRIVADANTKADAIRAAMKDSCAETLGKYAGHFETEKKKLLDMEELSKGFRHALLEAYKAHISKIQADFPSIDADAIRAVDFETETAGVLREKLNESEKGTADDNVEVN